MKTSTILKRFAVVLIVSLLLVQMVSVSQAASLGKGKPPDRAKWTLMVYIVGDNNLDSSVRSDIETELAPTGSSDEVQVVALADRAATSEWWQTLLFHVTPGMLAIPENAAEDWGERNMGDPQTLVEFIEWTRANYPADHYALSLWNHGWSWRPGHSLRDDTPGDSLDQHELEAVLDAVGPLDLIMYDACQMATIENQATVRRYAQAIVHSQEYVNWDGIEYERVLPALQANPDMTVEQLAVVVNKSASVNHERTGSAVALNANWDVLIEAVNEWALVLQQGLSTYRSEYIKAIRITRSFWGDTTAKDLYDAAYHISEKVSDPEIQAKSEAVMEAIDAVILDEWHTQPYHGAHGISIFWPTSEGDLDDPASEWNEFDYYREYLAFSRLTFWDEFLEAFVNKD
jgi:hypothetical protein